MFETFFTEARLSPISETLMELHRLFLTASIVSLLSEFGYVCLFVDAWTNDVSFGKWYEYWKFVWESCCCMDTCLSATSRIAPPKRTLHATFYSWTNIFMLPTALWKYLAWCMQLLGTAPSYAMSTLGDRKKGHASGNAAAVERLQERFLFWARWSLYQITDVLMSCRNCL